MSEWVPRRMPSRFPFRIFRTERYASGNNSFPYTPQWYGMRQFDKLNMELKIMKKNHKTMKHYNKKQCGHSNSTENYN